MTKIDKIKTKSNFDDNLDFYFTSYAWYRLESHNMACTDAWLHVLAE